MTLLSPTVDVLLQSQHDPRIFSQLERIFHCHMAGSAKMPWKSKPAKWHRLSHSVTLPAGSSCITFNLSSWSKGNHLYPCNALFDHVCHWPNSHSSAALISAVMSWSLVVLLGLKTAAFVNAVLSWGRTVHAPGCTKPSRPWGCLML